MRTLVLFQFLALTLSMFLIQFNTTNFVTGKDYIETNVMEKDITITLGNITDTVATIKELKKVKNLVIRLSGEEAKNSADYQIESYNLSYFEDNGWKDIYTTGSSVTTEMKKVLKRAKPGEKLYFERIVMKCPDGSSRKMTAIRVVTK